jgi:hypothetical protein
MAQICSWGLTGELTLAMVAAQAWSLVMAPAVSGGGGVLDKVRQVMMVAGVSSASSFASCNGNSGQMETTVVNELRRAIPAFVGLCARGKRCKEGRYSMRKRLVAK